MPQRKYCLLIKDDFPWYCNERKYWSLNYSFKENRFSTKCKIWNQNRLWRYRYGKQHRQSNFQADWLNRTFYHRWWRRKVSINTFSPNWRQHACAIMRDFLWNVWCRNIIKNWRFTGLSRSSKRRKWLFRRRHLVQNCIL